MSGLEGSRELDNLNGNSDSNRIQRPLQGSGSRDISPQGLSPLEEDFLLLMGEMKWMRTKIQEDAAAKEQLNARIRQERSANDQLNQIVEEFGAEIQANNLLRAAEENSKEAEKYMIALGEFLTKALDSCERARVAKVNKKVVWDDLAWEKEAGIAANNIQIAKQEKEAIRSFIQKTQQHRKDIEGQITRLDDHTSDKPATAAIQQRMRGTLQQSLIECEDTERVAANALRRWGNPVMRTCYRSRKRWNKLLEAPPDETPEGSQKAKEKNRMSVVSLASKASDFSQSSRDRKKREEELKSNQVELNPVQERELTELFEMQKAEGEDLNWLAKELTNYKERKNELNQKLWEKHKKEREELEADFVQKTQQDAIRGARDDRVRRLEDADIPDEKVAVFPPDGTDLITYAGERYRLRRFGDPSLPHCYWDALPLRADRKARRNARTPAHRTLARHSSVW